jgi:rhodanese-related sulfurtransferase
MASTPTLVELEPAEVADLLAAGEIRLIDVREPHEYDAAHIEGGELFPLSRLDPTALPQGEPPIVFYCAVGGRSAHAVHTSLAAGVPITRHLRGGISAWIRAGLPVVSD